MCLCSRLWREDHERRTGGDQGTSYSPEKGLYSCTMRHSLCSHRAVKAGGYNLGSVHRTDTRKAACFSPALTPTAFGPSYTVTEVCTACVAGVAPMGGSSFLSCQQSSSNTHTQGTYAGASAAGQLCCGCSGLSSCGCSPSSRASGHSQTGRLCSRARLLFLLN